MCTVENELREKLEDAFNNYLIDDTIKNKGLYLRRLKLLNVFLESNNLELEESKLWDKNKEFDKSIDVSDVTDDPYLVDDILEGGILD